MTQRYRTQPGIPLDFITWNNNFVYDAGTRCLRSHWKTVQQTMVRNAIVYNGPAPDEIMQCKHTTNYDVKHCEIMRTRI